MNNTLAKYLFYTLEYIRGEKVYEYLQELEKNQYLSKNEIKNIQKDKLSQLLKFVLKNNRYYQNKYKGFDAFNDFSHLPLLNKEELRENYKNIISGSSTEKLDLIKTSGSTGIPLKLYRDRVIFGYTLASVYRAHRWLGLDIGSKEAMLWGVPTAFKEKWKAKSRDFLLNRFREKEYNISEQTLLDFYKKIKRNRPDYIFGYSSMVYEFALFLKEKGLDGKPLKLKAAICTAESIHGYQRTLTEAVLGCRVISEYGAAETGIISFECGHGAHHISDDCIYLEIVDENNKPLPKGETGRVLVTVLNSFSSPIIRYELGDFAKISEKKCDCGVNLSVLDNITGRTSDVVITPEGKSFHSIIFYYIMKDIAEKGCVIKQFKVHQTSIDQLIFHIVKAKEFSPEVEDYLKKKVIKTFGESMKIEFRYHKNIDRKKSGKLRDFETNLDTKVLLPQIYSSFVSDSSEVV